MRLTAAKRRIQASGTYRMGAVFAAKVRAVAAYDKTGYPNPTDFPSILSKALEIATDAVSARVPQTDRARLKVACLNLHRSDVALHPPLGSNPNEL